MRRQFLGAVFLAITLAGPVLGDDPLRKIPKEANLVFKIEQPRKLLESVVKNEAYSGLQEFPQVREFLDSTQARRFFQVVKFLESELGSSWAELVDKIAGNGIALGVAIGQEPAPAVFVMEGQDQATITKVYALFLQGIREENERAETKQKIETGTHLGVEVTKVGKEFFIAQLGTSTIIANAEIAMKKALEVATGKETANIADNESLKRARKLSGEHPIAWGWLDFAKVKESQQSKDFFATSKKDIFQTMIFGSTVDAARRADFIAFVLNHNDTGYSFSIRLPAKRAEIDPNLAIHVPMKREAGSRPLLQPKGVLYSQSIYLDLGYLWKERKNIFNPENLKDVEKGVNDLNKVLPNTTFGELLEMSGPYHRIVAAHTGEKLYTKEPSQNIPPVAYVGSMRDAVYGERMDALLRAGGFLLAFQTSWKMEETTHDGVKIVTYRFSEKTEPKFADPENARFSTAPTFAFVNDSLIVGSTPGIVKLLIPELRKESKSSGAPEVWRAAGYATGAADFVDFAPEQTITQAILSQGIGLAEAKEQTKKLTKWLRTLGGFNVSIDHAREMYEFKVNINLK